MNQTDFKEFEAAMLKAAIALDVKLPPQKISIYFEDLADLPIGAVTDALTKARRAQVYAGFPKVAEIRKFAEGSNEDQAELAWRTALSLAGESSNASVRVYDPAMSYALQSAGGWISFVEMVRNDSPEMLASHERQFKTSYRLALTQPDKARGPEYFVGTIEAGNRQNLTSVATWALRRNQPTIEHDVLAVTAAGYLKIRVPFEAQTMALTATAQKTLQMGGEALRQYLPVPAPQRSLPPAEGEEMATPEEIAEIQGKVKALTSGRQFGPIDATESEAIH